MFEKLKQAVSNRVEAAREIRAHPGPADLSAIPSDVASAGGLGLVPPEVIAAYLGLEVGSIRPLDRMGPETSGIIGNKIRERMQAAGMGGGEMEAGEIVPGQNAARVERMRAQGMTEEQIAMIQDHMAQAVAAHAASGWTVEFVNGKRASVQLFDLDDSDSDFARLKAKYEYQFTKAGIEAKQESVFETEVQLIKGSPYPAYYLPGRLSARGNAHEAKAIASNLGVLHLDRTLAGLAILTLHSLEG